MQELRPRHPPEAATASWFRLCPDCLSDSDCRYHTFMSNCTHVIGILRIWHPGPVVPVPEYFNN